MHTVRSFTVPSIAVAALTTLAGVAHADINPWDFNVFSRSTIGSAGAWYGSDFQGAAGAVGNAWFGGFGLRTTAGSSPSLARSWYGGGALTFSGQFYNGGIESAGTVTMTGSTVMGPIFSGGDLAGTSGTVNGSATLAGTKTAPGSLTVTGTLTQNAAFTPTVNLAAVSSYFLASSSGLAATADTTLPAYSGGFITVNTLPGLNVVTVDGSVLNSAHTFTVNGSGSLVVNVTGAAPSLDSTTWTYTGGASSQTTLLNYNQASSLALSGGNIVNILAPNAAVTFLSGHVDGNLIVGSLTGGNYYGGQVNWTGNGYTGIVPTPGAAAIAGLAGALTLRRRR